MGVSLPNRNDAVDRQISISLPPAMNRFHVTRSRMQASSENTLQEQQLNSFDWLQLQQCLHALQAQLPHAPELNQLQAWVENLQWFSTFHHSSQLLIAVIDPCSLTLQYANDYCRRLLNIASNSCSISGGKSPHLRTLLKQRLSDSDYNAVLQLYRRHLFHFLLQELYQIDPSCCRLLETPAMVAIPEPNQAEPRYIEFWLRSQNLQITRLNPDVDEFADLNLTKLTTAQWEMKLTDPEQLAALEQRFCLSNYRIEGRLLLEGLDVTVREIIHQITQLLIDRDSILHVHKFRQVNQHLRSLFRTDHTIILTTEKDQIRVFMGNIQHDMDTTTYPLELLRESHTLRALQTNQVLIIRDLALDCRTALGEQLLQRGIRSLLLIPLVTQSPASQVDSTSEKRLLSPQVVGLVGLLSDRPHHFDGLDCVYAKQLIPAFTRALTSAQRQLVQQRFITNIHPAVEWRFLQEAERRSLGLPAEPIVFNQVYPLYGISDVRGSSEARNQAIQADLLAQFQLGIAVVQAVCATELSALTQQLQLDLRERMQRLEGKITVDAEVTEIRYLRDHLETYFEYFSQCNTEAATAIQTYQAACDNEHQCLYVARAEYDRAIGQVNTLLRETWERWQQRMQQITPHYCDVETTDGIDHMLYAGQSIDSKFGPFQLRSLRYEQLRAMCDCARMAMRIQADTQSNLQMTHLVLVQDSTVDIFHDETTEKLFDVRGTRDTRYEIVKKRIDKAIDEQTQSRITQPGMITIVYSTSEELEEYQQYLRYLMRETWIDQETTQGTVEPLQGVTGLKFVRVRVLSENIKENA